LQAENINSRIQTLLNCIELLLNEIKKEKLIWHSSLLANNNTLSDTGKIQTPVVAFAEKKSQTEVVPKGSFVIAKGSRSRG